METSFQRHGSFFSEAWKLLYVLVKNNRFNTSFLSQLLHRARFFSETSKLLLRGIQASSQRHPSLFSEASRPLLSDVQASSQRHVSFFSEAISARASIKPAQNGRRPNGNFKTFLGESWGLQSAKLSTEILSRFGNFKSVAVATACNRNF